MSQPVDVRTASAPPRAGSAHGLIRWVCTQNPFYVLSAGLFLAGLWISFGDPLQATNTGAMMAGLAGYTLLLAVTACLLVRFAHIWDDVRTVLLLVVLMFLATSVTFDEVLIQDRDQGIACYLGGLFFVVAVSEGVLRGIRLRLPAGFRLPYYLILALFFLYPLALNPLVNQPRDERLLWGLFGFASVAGLLFLTLLPAIRRGPEYVRDNGSPWPWPMYPWSLFVFLSMAVPGRAYLLCWSMHQFENGDRHQLLFGPYFLVPFGFTIAILLLEIGLVSARRAVMAVALAMPLLLILLARVGHRPDPIYQQFLDSISARLGGDPLFLTLVGATGFYAYAAIRRAPLAKEALTAALVALTVVGPNTLRLNEFSAPQAAPLLLAALLQLVLGLRQRNSWRCLLGGSCLTIGLALWLPADATGSLGQPIAFHLALLAALLVGALFDDAFARFLRAAGVVMGLLTCLLVLFIPHDGFSNVPTWALEVYPLAMAGILAGYGLFLGMRPALGGSAFLLVGWLVVNAGRGYGWLRQVVTGLDYFAVSLTLFACAVLVSLAKSGHLKRWLAGRTSQVRPSPDEG